MGATTGIAACCGSDCCWRCWRCGQSSHGFWPHYLCAPCVDVVSPEEIAWVTDLNNQPGLATWDMAPLGKEQGR